jgi:hypothetical protein
VFVLSYISVVYVTILVAGMFMLSFSVVCVTTFVVSWGVYVIIVFCGLCYNIGGWRV